MQINSNNYSDLQRYSKIGKIEDLKSDIHIQVFFDQLTNKKDSWLQEHTIDIDSIDLEQLYDSFLAKKYLNKTDLFGWIDKSILITRMNVSKVMKNHGDLAKEDFGLAN